MIESIWLIYSPNTVPSGDFDVVIDNIEYVEGNQSLMFLVRECSGDGGWRSPGIAQEIPVQNGRRYRVSFWLKNAGTEFSVRLGAVSGKGGEDKSVVGVPAGLEDWTFIEQEHTIPEPYERLRFQLSIYGPGTLWIDDVRVEPVAGAS